MRKLFLMPLDYSLGLDMDRKQITSRKWIKRVSLDLNPVFPHWQRLMPPAELAWSQNR